MMNKIYILSFVFFVLCSCKNEKTETTENIFTEGMPSDFLNFYDMFHSDSTFQMDHVIFPLQVQADGNPWLKENWVLHKPFQSQGGEFQRKYVQLRGIVIEQIVDSKGYYSIERRFSKSGDSYNLIFYKTTNILEQSEFERTQE